MTDETLDEWTTKVIEAWREAAADLHIEVVAPFTFHCDGRTHTCLAWLPEFGRARGAVVMGAVVPRFDYDVQTRKDAQQVGYYCSVINMQSYATYDRERFIETLADWGYYGPTARRPRWLE